jgi:hypothetical protein
MASLDDILTTQKNGVQGINSLTNITRNLAGALNSSEISTSTYFETAAGWVGKISIIEAGTTPGTIYDTTSVLAAATGNRLALIPNSIGIYTINMPVNNGIVVAPGDGQIVAMSYS